jgi:hypothetical protein
VYRQVRAQDLRLAEMRRMQVDSLKSLHANTHMHGCRGKADDEGGVNWEGGCEGG